VEEDEPERICAQIFQGDNSTREDQLKQKHTAARWTSLTEGQEDHYDLDRPLCSLDSREQSGRSDVADSGRIIRVGAIIGCYVAL